MASIPLDAQTSNVTTSNQLDDWEHDIARQIENTLGKNGLPPGDEVTWDFDTCIDGEWATVGFRLIGRAGGGIYLVDPVITPQGRDCKTSKDFQDIDLANANSLKELKNFLRETNPKNSASPREATTLSGLILPALTYVPFLPVYPPSIYPVPASCNPATSPDAIFVNHLSATVTRQNACSGALTAVIKTASNPLQLALTPDGSLTVVSSFDNALTFIDTSNNNPTTLQTPADINPSGVDISPDGTCAYVTSFNPYNPSLLKVDLAQRKIVQTLTLGSYPQSVFFNPDGSQAYVTFPFSNLVYIIDTLTTTVARTIVLPGPAFGVAFNSTGTRAYITCRTNPGTVQVFDASTYTILRPVTVGTNPVDVFVTSGDQFILVANFEGRSLSIFDSVNFKVTTVNLPGRPRGLGQIQ